MGQGLAEHRQLGRQPDAGLAGMFRHVEKDFADLQLSERRVLRVLDDVLDPLPKIFFLEIPTPPPRRRPPCPPPRRPLLPLPPPPSAPLFPAAGGGPRAVMPRSSSATRPS